jgi:hypothetical protein
MRYRLRSSGEEKAAAGVLLGAVGGIATGAAVTIIGGYEIGSAINNWIGLTGSVGRGIVDLVIMGVIAGPAVGFGFYGGMAVGGITGAVINPIVDGTRGIYRKIAGKDKESQNSTDSDLERRL